jgi:hypothetical protein
VGAPALKQRVRRPSVASIESGHDQKAAFANRPIWWCCRLDGGRTFARSHLLLFLGIGLALALIPAEAIRGGTRWSEDDRKALAALDAKDVNALRLSAPLKSFP